MYLSSFALVFLFLSTLSLRRATNARPETRQPCAISIHALLAESDNTVEIVIIVMHAFLSTLSLRRATIKGLRHKWASFYFYPRSPCGERPGATKRDSEANNHFYPRSPCGERRVAQGANFGDKIFLSTLSLRRATFINCNCNFTQKFLSTLSLRRATTYLSILF